MPVEDNMPMLTGIKVVDLTSVVFGPYATQILSDLGAEVIKVEPKIGDSFRYSGKPAKSRAMSPGHLTLNRGKKSVVLDLKDPDDAATMRGLIADADIFVHNIRGQAIERLGFDYEAMKKLNEQLIYIHCVGFGSGGPYSDLQAYDDVIQAATGTTSLASRVDGDPQPRFIPSLIADKVAGLHGAYATMAAIIHKLRTGRGQYVEVPMFEAFAHFMLKEHMAGKTYDPPVGSLCYSRQVDPDRQPFPTKDGYITIVPYTDESWITLYNAIGAPEFLDDERFNSPRNRMINIHLMYQGVAEKTPSKTTDEWIEIFRGARIPCMPVRDIDDILDDPHLAETGFFQKREHPTEGSIHEMREASRFSDWEVPEPEGAPILGQHNDEIRKSYQNDRGN